MGILKDTKHHRYYVFRHVNGENILYLQQVDSFTFMVNEYESATLFTSEEDAVKAAEYMLDNAEVDNLAYVVGRVIVDCDPLYAMIAVK